MTPEITLTLVGQIRAWEQRVCAQVSGAVWVAWLRNAAYGTIGIYVLPKPVAMRAALPHRSWVHVQGLLQPIRVLALDVADPRSEYERTQMPLLLHATSITRCERTTPLPAQEPQQLQVNPGRWIGAGYLAPARHIADVICFAPARLGERAVLEWNRPYGVIAPVGQHRYIRYVLIHAATPGSPQRWKLPAAEGNRDER